MKSLFLIFLLLSIGVASAQEDKPTQAFSGCYELKVEGWHPARTYSDQFLPRRFQLTGKATKLGLVPKNLDSNIRYDFGSFILVREGSI